MKKRLALLLAAVVLLTCAALPLAAGAESRISCVAINDTMPPELVNQLLSSGGAYYLPSSVMAGYGLGFSTTYSVPDVTITVSRGAKTLTFDLSNGKCRDEDGYYYSGSALLYNGAIYLPVSLLSSYFGAYSFTMLTDSDYGSVLRLNTGAAVLTDDEFMRAAKSVLGTYYRNYNKSIAPTPAPTPEPSPSPEPEHDAVTVRLGFFGLPEGATLTNLGTHRMKACFFLTEEDMLSDPDLVRRIVCAGHGIGIRCVTDDPASEFASASELLLEIARLRTFLITAPAELAESVSAFAAADGLAWCRCTVDATDFSPEDNAYYSASRITSVLDKVEWGTETVFFAPGVSGVCVSAVLNYLTTEHYGLGVIRETNA